MIKGPYPDLPNSDATLSINVGKVYAGSLYRCSHGGVNWYGPVDKDGIALLVREDLINQHRKSYLKEILG